MDENLVSQQFSIKYATKDLKDVVGQETTTAELSTRSHKNTFPQVSFFFGPPGSGKTTFQKIAGKHALCRNKKLNEKTQLMEVCGVCPFCVGVEEEKETLYSHYYNGYHITIDTVRSIEGLIVERAFTTAKKKIFIIDELQGIREERTMQAFLKIFEKPSIGNTHFFVGAMSKSKISQALEGRMLPYRLYPLSLTSLVTKLREVALLEGVSDIDVNEAKARALITIAKNCKQDLRIALSFLDRAITSNLWESTKLTEALGIEETDKVDTAFIGLLENSFRTVPQLSQLFIEDLEKRFLIMYKASLRLQVFGEEAEILKNLTSALSPQGKKNLDSYHLNAALDILAKGKGQWDYNSLVKIFCDLINLFRTPIKI